MMVFIKLIRNLDYYSTDSLDLSFNVTLKYSNS